MIFYFLIFVELYLFLEVHIISIEANSTKVKKSVFYYCVYCDLYARIIKTGYEKGT